MLTDGEVLEAFSAAPGPDGGVGGGEQPVRDHVLVSHPALRDGVSLFVPLSPACRTVRDIVDAAQVILRRTGDNRLCVSELKAHEDGRALDPRAQWRSVIRSGSSLVATHGDGPTMSSSAIAKDVTVWKVRHRLDSSVWCVVTRRARRRDPDGGPALSRGARPGAPRRSREMVARGLEGLEINASDLNAANSTINLNRLDINIGDVAADADEAAGSSSGSQSYESPDAAGSPRESPTRRLSSSYGLLLTPNAKGGAPASVGQASTMALFHDVNGGADMLQDSEDDVVKRLPGGSFAVFRGERKSPQPREG